MIAVGSTNGVKIEAVVEVLKSSALLQSHKIISCDVSSEISDQPLTLQETITGAKNRARNAFASCPNCLYGVGIESGLMEVSEARSGFMESAICCFYDGAEFFLGQSCAFELPKNVLDLVLNDKIDLQKACYEAKLTTNPKLGAAEGIIGILTNGRITRKEYTKQAVITALIQIEQAKLYTGISHVDA